MTPPHLHPGIAPAPVRRRTMALAGLLLALAAPAPALALAGPAATAGAQPPGRSADSATLPRAAAVAGVAGVAGLDLVSARIEAVDLAAGTITLRGQKVPLHAQQLRVLGAGGQLLGPRALRAGQAVRLALEPAAKVVAGAASAAAQAAEPPARRVVLIYIDG